jgi:hypothetical protein
MKAEDIQHLINDLFRGVVPADPEKAMLAAAVVALPVVLILGVAIVVLVYACEACVQPEPQQGRRSKTD